MEITSEIVRDLLYYDPKTGFFTWRERDRCWFKNDRDCKKWNTRFCGKRAGWVWTSPKTGYKVRVISILGKDCKEHRLAWIWMMNNSAPEHIDHINRDATDNCWQNIQASNYSENARNRSMPSINTSGISGLNWSKAHQKWRARVRAEGKQCHLGYFSDKNEAERVIIDFRKRHGYSSGHGVSKACYL